MARLLNINNYHYRRGGADAVYFAHASLMAENGWENAYFAMNHPDNESSPWSQHFVDELQRGKDYSLPRKAVMATKLIWSREAQRKLEGLLAGFRPDIAHLHNIYHHLSPAILWTLAKAKVPVVMTAHDLKLACPSYSMYANGQVCERCKGGNYANAVIQRCVHDSVTESAIVALESFTHRALQSYQRHVDCIVVPSRFFLDKFVEWGWATDAFEYIPNWLDSDRFRPEFEPGDYFLFFGRLAPIKGVGTLIRACARANVKLVVAGTGPMRQSYEALAAESGCDARFVGFKSGSDLHDLIRGARATVLPSEWYENAPISVLESAALGKPAIGSAIGGIPELIQPARTGWTFEAGNVESLSRVLIEAAGMQDHELAELGRAGREFVEQHFSRALYSSRIEALYDRIRHRV